MYPPDAYLEGKFLLIDKPLKWTSHDVVNKVRYFLTRYCKVKKIKVGHGGTLDPLATGLLILATGKATRKLQDLIDADKTYTGTITLGAVTETFDLESEPTDLKDTGHISGADIEVVRKNFTGEILQVPPIHSAIKKDGVPLYLKAREGKAEAPAPRKIHIHRFDIIEQSLPDIKFEVDCSKGTYIRSLAHDFGQQLGVGGHLSALRRTAIGPYHIKDALTVDDFLQSIGAGAS